MHASSVAVVRVDGLEPLQPKLFMLRCAGVCDPLRTEVVATPIGQASPHELREGFDERSLSCLADAQRSLRFNMIGDVDAFHENAADPAVRLCNRLINKVDEAILRQAFRPGGEPDRRAASRKGGSCRIHLIETLEKALPLRLGNGLADWKTNNVARADQLSIGLVCDFINVVRPAQCAHEGGRLFEQARQPLGAVERRLRSLSTQSGEGKVRAHVRDKFSRGERFGQIGVRSRSKALQAGFLSCPGGQ